MGAHTQLCICSQCLASMLPRQLSASRLATAHLISFPSVVLESSSTRSLMQSRAKSLCCLREVACASFWLSHSVSHSSCTCRNVCWSHDLAVFCSLGPDVWTCCCSRGMEASCCKGVSSSCYFKQFLCRECMKGCGALASVTCVQVVCPERREQK